MVDFLFFSFAVVYCAAASIIDIRQRIIPDWLTYGGMAVGLMLGGGYCLNLGSAFAINYAAMLAVALAFGYLLFALGVWAGGDAKLFWSFVALFGASGRAEALLPIVLFAATAALFLAATFIFNAGTILRKRKETQDIAIQTAVKSLGAAAVASLVSSLGANYVLAAIVAIAFLLVKLPDYSWVLIALASLALNADSTAVVFPTSFLLAFVVGTTVGIGLKVIRPSLTYRVCKKDLKEGMLLAFTVIERDGKAIMFKPKFDFSRLIRAIRGKGDVKKILQKTGLLAPTGSNILSDALDAGGLDAAQLQRLKKLENVRWLEVRTTMAFAPALCVCFLAALAGVF